MTIATTRHALALLVVLTLAGCASTPPAPVASPPPTATAVAPPRPAPEPPAPMVEHPPVEPADVPPAEQAPPPEPETPVPAPPAEPPAPPPAAAAPVQTQESAEDRELSALVADLARYSNLTPEDVRREVNAVTQNLNRQRNDANRVRLAMLYTLSRTAQDDQRALQLLETVAKASAGAAGIKQLANVLQAQITERVRVVREEQQKAAAAIQKLEALRSLERSLLRDRVRGGGGGGGGGSSGGGG